VGFKNIKKEKSCNFSTEKVKGAMPKLGRRRGAHLPLAAVDPVGG